MRAVVTRVNEARVTIEGETTASIGRGLLVLLGVSRDDGPDDAKYMAAKIAGLRIFADAAGAMNLDLAEVGAEILVVSQFTLYGDARKGRRPSFITAAGGELGEALYERVIAELRALGHRVATGRFGATMDIASTNHGPVTILLDSKRGF